MKKVKYVVASVVIILLFILNGEVFQNLLDTFTSNFYFIDYEYNEGDDRQGFVEDIHRISSNYNVKVFSVSREHLGNKNYQMTVYGSGEVYELLEEKYAIREREFKSILTGNIKVFFKDFSSVAEEHHIDRFYFAGEDENISHAVQRIFNEYGTTRIKIEAQQVEDKVMPMLWIAVLLFLVLLTFFDIGFQKKEVFIKISMGMSPWNIIKNNIIKDLVFYCGIFLASYFIISQYTFIQYELPLYIIICGGFLILNGMSYLLLLKYDLKQALSGKGISESLRGNCYVIKVFTLMLTMVTAATNVIAVWEGISFISQNEVVEEYEDYSFISLEPYAGANVDFDEYYSTIFTLFCRQYQKEKVALSVCNMDDDDRQYLYVNDKAAITLESIKEMEKIDETVGVHIFLPSGGDENAMLEIAEGALKTLGALVADIKYEVINYEGNQKILYFDRDFLLNSGYAENPVIIYFTFSGDVFQGNEGMEPGNIMHITNHIMYKVAPEEVEELEEEYGLKEKGLYMSAVSVTDSYEYYKVQVLRAAVVNSVITGLMIFLEILIISIIIKLEYQINAQELALKKVLGYSIMEKNKSIFWLIIYSSLLAVTATVTAALMFGFAKWYLIVISGTFLTVLELLIVIFFILKIEKVKIAKILKGGSL